MGPSGPVGLRREVEAAAAPFQWPSEADRFGSSQRYFFNTSSGNDQCHLRYPSRISSCSSRVMSMARLSTKESNLEPKRARIEAPLVLGFSADDTIETVQPYDDALMVTLRIREYDVKKVLIDQGSTVEIMYSDLYKGLNLKSKDLTAYNSPLVSFEGKTVTPKGQIKLPIQIGLDVVEVDFIVVDAYSPYTAIVARP